MTPEEIEAMARQSAKATLEQEQRWTELDALQALALTLSNIEVAELLATMRATAEVAA